MNNLCYSYLRDVNTRPIAGNPEIKRVSNRCGIIIDKLSKDKTFPLVLEENNFTRKEWNNYDKPLQNFRFDLNAPMIGLRPTYGSYYRY